MLYGCYRNNQIKIYPKEFIELCKSWIDPDDGSTISGLENASPDFLANLGVYPSRINNVEFNPYCEMIGEYIWEFDKDEMIFKRTNTVVSLSFYESLKNCANALNINREKYETSGFQYNYYGMDVIIPTDKDSSQPKLNASYVKAMEGTRSNTATWKFTDLQGNLIIVQLSNADLIEIADLVFDNIQDSFDLTSQIFWAMLGCNDTPTLKANIENGTINLNPWNV